VTVEYCHIVTAVNKTKDGDTAAVTTRITPTLREDIVGRIAGIDCPETRRPASAFEIGKAGEALVMTRAFITGPGDLWCRRVGEDDFGRALVYLWHELGSIITDLGQVLVDAGLATIWPTRWWQVYDPTGRR
jgi:endonuclease YncB( thermonuclease family)